MTPRTHLKSGHSATVRMLRDARTFRFFRTAGKQVVRMCMFVCIFIYKYVIFKHCFSFGDFVYEKGMGGNKMIPSALSWN